MRYTVIDTIGSHSFPDPHALLEGASPDGEVTIVIGREAGECLAELPGRDQKRAVLIELGTECLGVHTGEQRGEEGSNVLGFARFRLGSAPPTNLVELVRQPRTAESAIAAARDVLQGAGLVTALCGDFPGRILNRLVRPYFNDALRRLDEGLATADDLDATLRMGLGYPEGPISLLERTGLADHFEQTQALYEALGDRAYAPARRARTAMLRAREAEELQHALED